MSERYGATPGEWTTFDIIFGLTSDLLPVVSNPLALISENSKIKDKGKVPSFYNGVHKVVGISGWTSRETESFDIPEYMKEPDYGICLQTRCVRALDVDVPDTVKADAILAFIEQSLPDVTLPFRYRSNSGKFLMAFRLEGEWPKRTVKVEGGIIEFLGNGQQFIAAGTHPSGVRYEWDGLREFPEVRPAEFENLWKALTAKFGIEQPDHARLRKNGADLLVSDPTLDRLTVLDWGPHGQAHIECPFKAEHTTDSGESATSYFPAGTHGYEQGHFVCLHAHCAKRSDEEFLDAFGIRAAEFEAEDTDVSPTSMNSTSGDIGVLAPWPKFKRKRTGEIHSIIANLYQALKRDDVCSAKIAYDSFRDEVVITSAKVTVLNWRPLSDNDYTLLQHHLERSVGFEPIAIDLLRRTVHAVAFENAFDSVKIWLDKLEWDGTPRVDSFMSRYMRAEGNSYARAVSRYMWSAMAGRVLVPGMKADMVPIWESAQGRIKSSTVEALAPDMDFFVEVDLDENEGDLIRKMRGKLVGEINELRGLQTKDEQSINAFITRRFDEWVPKYMEKSRKLPRRIIFIGTTNKKEILGDETGKRRWLPIRVEFADLEAIIRDRDQLWAEGREIFRKEGLCFQEAEALAPEVHKEYAVTDPWENVIYDWCRLPVDIDGNSPLAKGYVTMTEIMRDALHIETKNMKGNDGKRIAKILKGAGYDRVKKRMGGRTDWVWRTPGGDLLA